MHAPRNRWQAAIPLALLLLAASSVPVAAATQNIDLDAQSANGAESKIDLNVLQTFPVQIENVVTNKTLGDIFTFGWPSAGLGGFSSSLAPGTLGGVGVRWTWTTNQTVYAFTGTSCVNDICFLKTAGPDSIPGTCTAGCGNDGVQLSVAKGANAGEVALSWSGGTAAYGVFRSSNASTITASANRLGQTSNLQYSDVPPAGTVFFYRVRGSSCLAATSCTLQSQCGPSEQGSCVSRGPFAVPGRSLFSNDVTVSSAALTSSLITFFSPPQELFRATSTAQPGGFKESLVNRTGLPLTVATDSYPPGCCPFNPDVPDQLNCNGTCVDYLHDSDNCGACGNVCGAGTCCTNGNCVSLCDPGEIYCNGTCRDPQNDNDNCGGCGITCGEGNCCVDGACTPYGCEEGRDNCDGACIDVANDDDNCGSCGNACSGSTCCFEGSCTSLCGPDRALCGTLCRDLQNDPNNCGACGHVCNSTSICTGGACVPCGSSGGRRDACDNRCVNIRTDPYNCGGCGISCNVGCPSNFHGVCSNGQSCSCAPGPPAPQPPSNIPPPTDPYCPNTTPPGDPTDPFCLNPDPSGPTPPDCPVPGPPAPQPPSPVCVILAGSVTVPPGETATTCHPGGIIFKEVPTTVRVCGDGIPGDDGECLDGVSKVTTGTLMRYIPDDTPVVGGYPTPFGVHVKDDTSKDGLLQPGETANLLIDVLNAGPKVISNGSATLIAPSVDLTDDGHINPVQPNVLQGSSSYGTIPSTALAQNCEPVDLQPKTNTTLFRISLPSDTPGDVSLPLTVRFTGTVDGGPFSFDMPLSIGVAGLCVPGTGSGDYDGLNGLLSPMGPMVPVGDALPLPLPAINAGSSKPLKLQVLCGTQSLGPAETDPPEIVGLSEATRGELDIPSLDLNDSANPDDPLFKYDPQMGGWRFQMRTANLGEGTFTLTIRIGGRKDYITGFVTVQNLIIE